MIRFRLRALAVLAIVVAVCVYAAWDGYRDAHTPEPLIGMVRRTEIHIAPEISGRIGQISVGPGDRVAPGAVVAKLDAPDLFASLAQANANAASSAADRANVYSGVRAEEQTIADKAIEMAAANLDYAREELDRSTTLAKQGFASGERLDQETANFSAESATLALKQAAYAEAVAGPTREQRAIADAKLTQAKAVAAVTAAHIAKTALISPIEGEVKTVVGEPGEIVRAGQTVVTIEARGRPWFSVTAREDQLGPIAIGAKLKLTRNDGKTSEARVTEMLPLGDFATWQATRAVGDHDLNSFAVRLDPTSDDDNDLEPGMSIWLTTGG